MNGLAPLAIKEAAGIGAGLLPAIPASAVDGFAVGMLLSGLCFLSVLASRRGLRYRTSKHRLAESVAAVHQPEIRHSHGRHAAPSNRNAGQLPGGHALDAVAVRE